MSALADFLDRLDDVNRDQVPDPEKLIADAEIARVADLLMPTFRLRAERAGVELGELTERIEERIHGPLVIVLGRIGEGNDPLVELHQLATSVGLQFFLAGALWQSERQMGGVS